MILVIFGYIIRFIAIISIKDTKIWKVKMPIKLKKDGIYKHIRHPMYSGTIIMIIGLALMATNNIGTSLLFGYIYANFLIDRIDREENFLVGIFGNEYVDYVKRTKMLIPFLW